MASRRGNAVSKAKKKYDPVKQHTGHQWMMVRGNWGPHKAKYICADCDGAHIKWHTVKRKHNEA